jgi:ABC-type multidrug transport system fused ATPase/permease subunit
MLQIENQSLQVQATILGLMAAGLLLGKTILSIIFVRKTVFFLSRRSAAISSRLISRVLSQSLTQVQSKSMQQTLYAVTSGVDSIAIGVLGTCVALVSDISLFIIMTIGLFVVDPVVALSTFVTFTVIAYLLYHLLQVRAKSLGEEQAKVNIQSNEKILEVLNSYREIIVRNRRSYYSREIGIIRLNLANVNAERAFMPNISKYVIELTVVLGSLIIGMIQFSLNDASHAVAVLSVFLAASTRISPAVLRMQQGAIYIRGNIGSAGPTLDLIESLNGLSAIESSVDSVETVHLGFKANVEIKNIGLTYPTKKTAAVKDISLTFSAGNMIAFVGPSGAGKTTIIDILLGVLIPDKGSIQICGMSPQSAIAKWPGSVGYVPQDVMISNGTVRENVALGFPLSAAKDQLIWDALKIAQLDDFVLSLPDGLDTSVGDRGTKISGGQRQRLGIARAMFTKPKLLVLDEATSSLDGETEANISESIQTMKGDVTVVVIAHRLSTVRHADLVVYMDSGKALAIGSFEEVRMKVPDFDRQAQLMGL